VQLVGTINPDFRNIESSILSLDFSRFARIADENRPFFQEGSEYYNSAVFASQLIREFDLGINTYGKLNDKTQFGFLNTLDFNRDAASVVNLTYAPSGDDNYRMTVTRRDRPGLGNTAYLARYSHQQGPWNLFLRDMGSDDSRAGFGRASDANFSFFQQGFYGGIGYTRVEQNFQPALGFFPETNYQGPELTLFYDHPVTKGPLQSYGGSLDYLDYTRIGGKPYRRDINGSVNATSRQGLRMGFSMDRPEFEGSHDRIDSASLTFPVSDPYRRIGLGYSWGEINGDEYRLVSANGSYRLFGRLQLTGSFQKFHLGGLDTEQTIFGGNYDLGNDRSISGRMVQSGSNTNWYAAFRRSGNRGAEYFLILGDPSALRFRPSLIVKVVVPFRV
jgi:hypothetical protein